MTVYQARELAEKKAQKLQDRIRAAEAFGHHLQLEEGNEENKKRVVCCTWCGKAAARGRKAKWEKALCKGVPWPGGIHPTHKVRELGAGLTVCKRCGARTGGRRLVYLARMCKGRPKNKTAARLIARLARSTHEE